MGRRSHFSIPRYKDEEVPHRPVPRGPDVHRTAVHFSRRPQFGRSPAIQVQGIDQSGSVPLRTGQSGSEVSQGARTGTGEKPTSALQAGEKAPCRRGLFAEAGHRSTPFDQKGSGLEGLRSLSGPPFPPEYRSVGVEPAAEGRCPVQRACGPSVRDHESERLSFRGEEAGIDGSCASECPRGGTGIGPSRSGPPRLIGDYQPVGGLVEDDRGDTDAGQLRADDLRGSGERFLSRCLRFAGEVGLCNRSLFLSQRRRGKCGRRWGGWKCRSLRR